MGPDLESLFELEKSSKIRTLCSLFSDSSRGFRISKPEADGLSFLCVIAMAEVGIGHIKSQCPHSVPESPVYVLWTPKTNSSLTISPDTPPKQCWIYCLTHVFIQQTSTEHMLHIRHLYLWAKSLMLKQMIHERILLRQDRKKTGNITGMKRERPCLTLESG